jgi:hypothetical protein
MTSLNETKIIEALAAAERADSPGEQDKHERAAIAAWRQIAIDTGLDRVMLDRVRRDMQNDGDGPLDLEAPIMSPRAAWKALASFLNGLRVGLMRTTAGEAILSAAKTSSEGRGSFLNEPVTLQGIDAASAREHNVKVAVVSLAAAYDGETECGPLAALTYAVGELSISAAALGVRLNVETLKREINDPGGGSRRKDEGELAAQYRRMRRLMSKAENRTAVSRVEDKNVAARAAIRGTSSPVKT